MSTTKKSKAWYEENAEKYTAHVRNPKDSLYHSYYEKPAMYALLPDLKNKSVLSIGCGSGEDSNYLFKNGALESFGIDLSEALIKIASDSYPNCKFKVMDMEEISFSDESFDFVYSSLAIHYLEDWRKVFKEVFRVLKPSSFFLFSCSHPVRFSMDNVSNDTNSILRLELSKNKETKELSITGDYLSKRKIVDSLGSETVDTWIMPIGDIIKTATDAGFQIETLVEPKPLEELKQINPNTYLRLSKIPEFVIFKLKKY